MEEKSRHLDKGLWCLRKASLVRSPSTRMFTNSSIRFLSFVASACICFISCSFPFSTLVSLRKLHLIKPHISTLSSLAPLYALEALELSYANQLNSLEGIEHMKESLLHLQIDGCKNLATYNEIGSLNKLRKLKISRSGEIQSLNFAKLLPLEELVLVDTKVKDNDYSVLQHITKTTVV
jgi:hypothetical protein